MIDPMEQSVILHFKDGSLQKGLLQSRLPAGKTIRFLPQSSITDRRRAPRVPFVKEVSVGHLGVRRVIDLSIHGMYVETLNPSPLGSALPISLRIGNETIELNAAVVFNDPGIGMGMEFGRLTSSVRHKLAALVRSSLNSKDHHPSRDRRERAVRKTEKHNDGHKYQHQYPGWAFRKKDRRRNSGPPSDDLIDVDLSRMKSIFFLNQNGKSIPRNGTLHSSDKKVIVSFCDGEEIQGTLSEVSPENTGFFMDLGLREKISCTVYVIKTAVKNIRYL
jgi:hypothetical protein